MKKLLDVFNFLRKNLPLVKYYANAIIHFIDMLDGVQDWQKNNPPPEKK
ncbi:hypothetical protein [Epilithonimonas mollis]|uniref:Uncharacterized protein n=1 Tax=Epilithonimonas mollis TaxID=216903 RepID=A0A1M6U2K7_9FLAO|nr:hypothetical protein [Epilithonimonas mollis]SHK63318.1 hypothetical protein SAMN05444371_3079 [Epilithonimonas mollis]